MTRLAITIAAAALGALFFARLGQAQTRPTIGDSQAYLDYGSRLHVYLVTFGPGDEVWEKFGHNSIRVVIDGLGDEAIAGLFPKLDRRDIGLLQANPDLLYHWGAFQFGNNFVWHFIQGKLFYDMAITLGKPTLDSYGDGDREHGPGAHRDIRQQELNLTIEQKITLVQRLWANYDDPSLRTYRYDYYTDNCSTRTRDAIDNIADHRLRQATQNVSTGTTYRFHTDRLVCHTVWLYVALQGVLGQPIDRPIDQWQEMFLPDKVHDRVNELKVSRDGRDVPLVLSDEWIYKSDRTPEPLRPPVMAPWLLLAGLILGGVFATLGRIGRRSRAARWTFVLVTTPWLLLMGLGGGLIVWAWAATDHIVARNNENVLHVSILALPLLVMLPRLAFGKRRGAALAKRLAMAMAALSVLGLLLKVLPWFHQVNWSIIGLCLPANAALAYAAWMMGKTPATDRC